VFDIFGIRKRRKEKERLKRERIVTIIGSILSDVTKQSWSNTYIDDLYISAILHAVDGNWEKALQYVTMARTMPPQPLNCRCTVIPIQRETSADGTPLTVRATQREI